MNDTEKIIKGLECLIVKDKIMWESCEDCPFGNTPEGCLYHINHDAIALLKAQEPRLLTLQEADIAPYVWLKSKEGGL